MIETLANEWLRLDKIQDLLASNNINELETRLTTRLKFGTAGLRAEMGAGTAYMNDLTVIQTTQGLVSFLLSTRDPGQCSVVIGFDHRAHFGFSSKVFAKLAASVFVSKKIKVYLYPEYVHTPLVPFGVTSIKATCGIMITASHNPKQDNGYKLYWDNGCQIVPPIDSEITQFIQSNLEPWVWDEHLVDTATDLVCNPLNAMINSYMATIKDLYTTLGPVSVQQPVKICYTAMHGVGYPYMQQAFTVCGLNPLFLTEEQIYPNPHFPTVTNPNPEEGKGALKLSMQAADTYNCTVILANDPDADRLAVAERQAGGEWVVFTGNQLGIMLAAYLLQGYRTTYPDVTKLACLTTTVSSTMLKSFAECEGLVYAETLTGFKYLGNRAKQLLDSGEADKVMFAYEQAIGFMCGSAVLDKDGVSAGVCIAHLAQHLATNSSPPKTLYAYLQTLYAKYGMYTSNDGYIIEHDSTKITTIFDRIRPQPVSVGDWIPVTEHVKPQSLLGTDFIVTNVRDASSMSSNMVSVLVAVPDRIQVANPDLDLSQAVRLTLRTSGTEPKVKWYSEMVGKCSKVDATNLDLVSQACEHVLAELVQLVKAEWLCID